MPTGEYAGDANRVQLKEPQASQFFAALRNDKSLTPEPTPTPSSTATSGTPPTTGTPAVESSTPPVTAYQKSIQPISVANASAVVGRSLELLQTLASAGFTNSWQAGDLPPAAKTQLLYGPDMKDVAGDIAALFKIPASAVSADPSVSGLSLIVGTDWVSGSEFGKIVVPKDIVASTADQGGECLTINPLYYTF